MKNSKIYKSIALFFQRLKPLSWKERMEYIVTYYKEVVFVFAIAMMLICAILFSALQDRREVVFGGVFANADITQDGYDYLHDGLMQLLGVDEEKQMVELSSTAFEQVEELSQLDYAYNAAMKPISLLEDGKLDFLVMNEEAMMFYMTQYALMDLGEIFTEEELAQMEDQLIYLELELEQTRYPVAIRVDDMPFFRDNVTEGEPLYFSFTGGEHRAQEYITFWNYLMDWE